MSNSQNPEAGTERRTLRSAARQSTSNHPATNPRRRQRDSDGTQRPPAPKRRRKVKVDEQTFEPPSPVRDAAEDAINSPALESHASRATTVEDDTMANIANGTLQLSAEGSIRGSVSRATPNEHNTMTIRGRPKRHIRGDNATVLAQNDCYSVKLLPSTPKELRRDRVEYRGSIGLDNTALAVTHDKAIIWEYTAHSAVSNTRTFDIPFPSRPTEPLPFGALVSSGLGSLDSGLLLISPTSGQAVFHESIDRATSLGLFQNRKTGVEGSIGYLYSGETVVNLVSADRAGFLVVLNSGRILQLTLRDAQGKPKISSQILQTKENSSGSFFGSFSSLWSGSFKKDLTAVHTRPTGTRGQMQAVALTGQAELLIWDLDWSGQAEFRYSIPCKEVLVQQIRDILSPELAGRAEASTALDFAILDRPTSLTGTEVATLGATAPLGLFILLRAGTVDDHFYLVADVAINGNSFEVNRIVRLSTYQSRGDVRFESKPKLMVPKPGHTAVVIFEDSTILLGTRDPAPSGPDAQLYASYMEPDYYEEAIQLRQGKGMIIESTWDEGSRGSQALCVAFVRGVGLVRISASDIDALDVGWSISAMTRIEQAVFFGAMQQENIIDFSRPLSSQYSLEEVENAAIDISEQILRAETKYTNVISRSPASMEQHLAIKAQALKALITHVRQNCPALSRATMWRLLWNAERVAAAQQLWLAFEEHIDMMMENGKRKATLFDEVCDWFNNDDNPVEPFAKRKDLEEEEPVRKFFIGGLHRIEKLFQNTKLVFENLETISDVSNERILRFVIQTNDVFLRGLRAAFSFRSENAADYGILPELIEDGVLIDAAEYTDVPEFWTSTEELVHLTDRVAKLSRQFATVCYENYAGDPPPNIEQTFEEIADANPDLIEVLCLQFKECIAWRSSRTSQKDQVHATKLRSEFEQVRFDQFRELAGVGRAEAGMRLAERYRDMNTLTVMVVAEDQFLEEQTTDADERKLALIYGQRDELNKKVLKFFERYGSDWADAFFDKLFSSTHVGQKLEQAQLRWREPLAKYLRAEDSRAKICWINDVTLENDFSHASRALANAARVQESNLWAKKVELSMAKLALLAAQEAGEPPIAMQTSNGMDPITNDPQNELALVKAQEQLYQHLYPDIIASLDREAELEICMQKYATHVKDWATLSGLLSMGFERVLRHTALPAEDLIDVLTLMDIDADDREGSLRGSEFMLALLVLDAAAPSMPPARFEMLLQLIWKRCYIYDDWAKLNTGAKSKQSDHERIKDLRKTATWLTLFHLRDSEFFRSATHVELRRPSDCLGSACQREDMAYRFPSEDLLDPILHDLKSQDEVLQSFVADRHLDELMTRCDQDAQAYIGAMDEANVLKSYAQHDADICEENGVQMNGHANGAVQPPAEGNGDVEME